MSTIATASVLPAEDNDESPPVQNVITATQAPVLITEQEVVFSTAAAIPVSPPKSVPRWIAAVRLMFARASDDERPARKHYPRRHDFLETSRMARAMERL